MAVSENLTPAQRLSAEIAELPIRLQAASKRGFQFAATLSDADQEKLTRLVLHEFVSGNSNITDEVISKEIGIPRADSSQLAVPFMVSIGYLTQFAVSADDFISIARNILFEPSEEHLARNLVEQVIPSRAALSASASRSRLANAVLPSLSALSIAVDVRLGFDENVINEFVPVAIVRIDTDTEDQTVLIQLSKADVSLLLEQLTTAKNQMDLADNFLQPLLKSASDRRES